MNQTEFNDITKAMQVIPSLINRKEISVATGRSAVEALGRCLKGVKVMALDSDEGQPQLHVMEEWIAALYEATKRSSELIAGSESP